MPLSEKSTVQKVIINSKIVLNYVVSDKFVVILERAAYVDILFCVLNITYSKQIMKEFLLFQQHLIADTILHKFMEVTDVGEQSR